MFGLLSIGRCEAIRATLRCSGHSSRNEMLTGRRARTRLREDLMRDGIDDLESYF